MSKSKQSQQQYGLDKHISMSVIYHFNPSFVPLFLLHFRLHDASASIACSISHIQQPSTLHPSATIPYSILSKPHPLCYSRTILSSIISAPCLSSIFRPPHHFLIPYSILVLFTTCSFPVFYVPIPCPIVTYVPVFTISTLLLAFPF